VNRKTLTVLEFDRIIRMLESKTSTAMGRERAASLVPETSFDVVSRRLAETDEAFVVESRFGPAPLSGIRDVRPSLDRVRIGGVLSPEELWDIAETIAAGRRLKRFVLRVRGEVAIPSLAALAEGLPDLSDVEEPIRRSVGENGEILDGASDELAQVRREIRAAERRVRERLEQLVRSPSVVKMLQEPIVTIRNERFVLPVKAEHRASFGGIVHDQSASGATLFIEPEPVVELNNRLRELRLRERREIERVLAELSSYVRNRHHELRDGIDRLGELDFRFAKAALAREMRATLPVLNARGYLNIRKGRHPLIAADRVVPLDLELGGRFRTIVVTGPNTGGKTVVLKTVGLFCLMAASGLFVPAEEGTELAVFDGVFADIGDEQSIEQNLSTFSGHMTNVVRILNELSPNSLVLLDEIGAGTDPEEGAALAVAILDHLHRTGCRVVVTTHFGELKAYAYNRDGMVNASMEFDERTLAPTYRLLLGVPGRSMAFTVAERLGLPKPIVEQARGQVSETGRKVDAMLAALEADRLAAERGRQEAEALRREAERLREDYEAKLAEFREQKSRLLEDARRQAREIVAHARREAEAVVADLRRMAQEERAAFKEHHWIEARRRLDEAEPEPAEPPFKRESARRSRKPEVLAPGDEVRVLSLGREGVLAERAGPGQWVVRMGVLKLTVKEDDIEKIAKTASEPPVSVAVRRTRETSVRTELDVRGVGLEEAKIETDRFLDEAMMAGLSRVYVIHGKGTGVLREGLRDFLKTHGLVKSFRPGEPSEGGNGVTVVELR